MQTKPKYGYCQLCQGPIVEGMQWTLTGNMYRIHYNNDHCIRNLHIENGMIVNPSSGRRLKIKSKHKAEYAKQEAQSHQDDIRYARTKA